MSRKRFSAEEIVNKLRQADVLISQGRTITQACKQIGGLDMGKKRSEVRDQKSENSKTYKRTFRVHSTLGIREGIVPPRYLTGAVR